MRSPISVTRRHIDFLFNREETVVTTERRNALDEIARVSHEYGLYDGDDFLLPPSDESKVGQD